MRDNSFFIFLGIIASVLAVGLFRPQLNALVKKVATIRKPASGRSLLMGLGGDTMLGRLVNEIIPVQGDEYVWGNLLEQLRHNDLNLINLECTFTRSMNAVPKTFNFKSDPNHVSVLKTANIGFVSLANNHIGDFDIEGQQETIATLDAAGIAHAGAGDNSTLARAPLTINKNGIRIGIISTTDNEPEWVATQTTPGTNYFSVDNPAQLLQDIKAAKSQVDVLIVSLHWGPNMRQRPTEPYVKAAHAMIDAGADVIHGHSAHVFQGIERYNNGIILYDTGDLVDDYRVDSEMRNDLSFLFLLTITKEGIAAVTLLPTAISNMQVNHATPEMGAQIIESMRNLSAEFNTEVVAQENGTARVVLK